MIDTSGEAVDSRTRVVVEGGVAVSDRVFRFPASIDRRPWRFGSLDFRLVGTVDRIKSEPSAKLVVESNRFRLVHNDRAHR